MFVIDYLRIFTPLLLHVIISNFVVMMGRGILDATALTTLNAVVFLPVAWGLYLQDRKNETERVSQKASIKICLLCFVAGGILNLAWSSVLNLLRITDQFSNQSQEALLSGNILAQIVGLGLLVPLAEELLFRALVFQRMKRLLPEGVAIVLSSLLFAVFHGNMVQMLYAFPIALIITIVYAKGKHLAYPVSIHLGANLLTVVSTLLLQ